MNREQYLLTKLMEECAEVTQVCSKALVFGLDDYYKTEYPSNRIKIQKELEDLMGVMFMLVKDKTIAPLEQDGIDAKEAKVEKYMQYSRDRGILE
jgi:NTP pyrophosphatase (non-canonical NTP hydrolase)